MLEEYEKKMQELTSETIAYEYFDLQNNQNMNELNKSKSNSFLHVPKGYRQKIIPELVSGISFLNLL